MAAKSYLDAKGRKRWVRNDEVAFIVKQLGDYLIIGGYPEAHAKRYAQIAHTISRWPESVDKLEASGNLDTLPGVGGTITEYLQQIILTGTTDKFKDNQYGKLPPRSVLELTQVQRLGAKTAKMLFQELGIKTFKQLHRAAKKGELKGVKGIGPKMVETILNTEQH